MSNTVPAPVPLPLGRLVSVGAVIFCANAALLVLQLVAGRLLAPFIGSSLETWTSIIGVFLTGIALGNGFGGKLADRYPTPRTLAALLAAGAVAALWMLVFPLILSSTGLHKSLPLGPRIPMLAAALCLPAGFVLSLLTPLAIKLGLPDVSHTGRVAGLIFALSTLGCLLGNYVTGFYLIPTFTINTLVIVSAAVLVALAVVSQVVVRAPQAPAREPLAASQEANVASLAKPQAAINPHAFTDIRIAYLIVFLSSFCGMTLELTASRVLAMQLGVSLFTWTGIIGVMLAGTALGNFTGGQLADRVNRPGSAINPRYALAATLCFAAAATVFMFVAMALVTRFKAFHEWGPITQVMGWTFSLFFLPMFALGLVSPQVIRLAVPDVGHAGRVAGRVYAWSTVGAIAGTFATGYVLLSALGMYQTVLAASLVVVGASLLAAKVWDNNPLLYLFSVVLGGITGGFILTNRDQSDEYLVKVESNYYTIKVTRAAVFGHEAARALNLDKLMHSVVDPYDPLFLYYTHEFTQVELTRAARAENPDAKVLVIGGGGYTFPRYVNAQLPDVQVDVVEIDPKVTQVAFEHLGLERHPKLNPIHMDGRQFVAERAAPGGYDLVIQDAVNDLSVPAHLMTKEYNDAVKAVLKPDGVYLLTIIDSVADGKLWKAAMATLAKTYPAENVVMLRVPDPMEHARAKLWHEERHVLVIYASNTAFSHAALENAVRKAMPDTRLPLSTFAAGEVPVPGAGPAHAARLGPAGIAPKPFVYTKLVDPALLKTYTDREPGLVLTDQFCPIDNLMADVFRRRER
jgi:predicted membrane-bound spermidine synthase